MYQDCIKLQCPNHQTMYKFAFNKPLRILKMSFNIKLHCTEFPGLVFGDCQNVHLGVQRGDETIWETPGDVGTCAFEVPIEVGKNKDGSPNFLGPFVHGPVGGRFLYLVWFDKKGEVKTMFRRAKINLQHLDWDTVNAAIFAQKNLEAVLTLTDKKGGPACATLKRGQISWKALPS